MFYISLNLPFVILFQKKRVNGIVSNKNVAYPEMFLYSLLCIFGNRQHYIRLFSTPFKEKSVFNFIAFRKIFRKIQKQHIVNRNNIYAHFNRRDNVLKMGKIYFVFPN